MDDFCGGKLMHTQEALGESVAIQVTDLEVGVPNRTEPLFSNVNLQVKQGEIVALVGLSGCGKSVLAKSIAGMIPNMIKLPIQGEVKLWGKDIKTMSPIERISAIGYIFQNPDNQIFSSVVETELAFGPENLCLSYEEIKERVTQVLQALHMEEYRYANTNELSGGQKQLVAIGSILTLQPRILICDEILCQLDEASCNRVIELLQTLRENGMTIFIIEHDLNKLKFVDKIYTIKERQFIEFQGEIG